MDKMGTPNNTDSLPSNTGNESTEATEGKPQVDFEKRLKDTQAAYTKSRQEIAALKAELTALRETGMIQGNIPAELKQELEELKFKDPDAWRSKLNELEVATQTNLKQKISEKQQTFMKEFEQDDRAKTLEDFNRLYKVELTESILQNEIPMRIHNKLNSGEIDYVTFLAESAKYINTPKVIGATQEVLGQPDLGSVGGSTTPSEANGSTSFEASYNKSVF